MGGNRGVSNVVGVVLLVATVLSAAALVAGFSAQALSEQTQAVAGETTAGNLDAIAEHGEAVAYGSHDRLTVDLADTGRLAPERLSVHDSGHISVEIGAPGGGWTTVLDRRLGTVRVDGGGATVAYQGGGIWRYPEGRQTGVETLRAPPLSAVQRSSTSITLPVFVVDGAVGPTTQIVLDGRRPVYESLYVPAGQSVRITVESAFAAGWADAFERSVPEDHRRLRYESGRDRVTVTYGLGRDDPLYLHGAVHRLDLRR